MHLFVQYRGRAVLVVNSYCLSILSLLVTNLFCIFAVSAVSSFSLSLPYIHTNFMRFFYIHLDFCPFRIMFQYVFYKVLNVFLSNFSIFVVTEVHGRTFGVWTLLTCTLCYLCAFNLDNKPLYLATLLSFIYAFGHFLTEYLIYQTMAIANLTTVSIFAGMTVSD